jgi:hypothetical protein
MSRKILFVAVVAALAGLLVVDSAHSASVYLNVFSGGTKFKSSDATFLYGASLGRSIGRLSPEASVAFSRKADITHMTYTGNAVFSFTPDARGTLFVLAGVGGDQLFVNRNKIDWNGWKRSLLINAGAGIRLRASDRVGVRLEVRDLITTKGGTKAGNFEGRAGVQFKFGR